MKKLQLLFIALSFCFIGGLSAQISIGGGLVLGASDLGLQGRLQKTINETIDGSASFTFFLVDGGTVWSIDADAHYVLSNSDGLTLYPLAGLNFFHFSSGGFSDTDIGLNLGGGATYELQESLKLFAELKYVTNSGGDLWITAGVLFPFGG